MSSAPKHQPRRKLDAYYTPDDLARALVGVLPVGWRVRVWEPHVGGGAFAEALHDRGCYVMASDIDPDNQWAPSFDPLLLACDDFLQLDWSAHWIVGNPPYRDAMAHVRHALRQTDRHVVFLLRLAFLESRKRAAFWSKHPCRKIWVLSERPSFTGGGTDSAAYGWFWWDAEHRGPTELEVLSWKGRAP